jgi:hypothetical protein
MFGLTTVRFERFSRDTKETPVGDDEVEVMTNKEVARALGNAEKLRPWTNRWDNAPGGIVITKRVGELSGDESRWHGEAHHIRVAKKNDDTNYKGPTT